MHYTTERFWKCYDALPEDIQQVADRNYQLLKADPSSATHHSPIENEIDKLQGTLLNFAMNIQKLLLTIVGTISIGMCVGASPSLAAGIDFTGKTCRVTDPTGTPLNVRSSPKGRVISKISNQLVVYPQSIEYDDTGKPWMLISVRQPGGDRILGWVVREFISCYQ